MKQLLSNSLQFWRAERPDEWTMDEFIREAKRMEAELEAFNSAQQPVAQIPSDTQEQAAEPELQPAFDNQAERRAFQNYYADLFILEKTNFDFADDDYKSEPVRRAYRVWRCAKRHAALEGAK